MSIASINVLSNSIANDIIDIMFNNPRMNISYNPNGTLIGSFTSIFTHKGLYGFVISKNNNFGIIYIGKSESNDDDRLHQHLTGLNKNKTLLSSSVGTKHKNIKQAITDGFQVELALFNDPNFIKSSLACLEIETIIIAQSKLLLSFPSVNSWNLRVG